MLKKLLKYEIMATGRIFLPLYGVLLVFALINRALFFLYPNEFKMPQVISMILYITILVGMFVMTFVVMIQRFYKNLLSDEGYLMFTLPTKPWKHITSKLLTSILWMVASGIAAILSILIIAFDKAFISQSMQVISDAVSKFFEVFGASSILLILEFILIVAINLASNVLMIYASIALGHLLNQHRILASFGAFLALNAISQILTVIAGAIPGGIGSIEFSGNISSLKDLYSMMPFIHIAVWYIIIFTAVLSAGYFIVTNYILSKRLNLE